MKQYGANKATEFTARQINVVFAKAKKGDLKIEKWFINELYSLADYYGYDDNRNVESCERQIKDILEAIFENELEKAQNLIDRTTNDWFENYSSKYQKKFDRSFL